jgi:hypothetical protein
MDKALAIEENGAEFLMAFGRAARAEYATTGARDLGYGVGVLGSSEMGYGVYHRLGFRENCRIGLYEWRP